MLNTHPLTGCYDGIQDVVEGMTRTPADLVSNT
jgi:hypothetical protein